MIVVALSLAAVSAVYATATALATPSTGLTTTILTKSLFDEIDINAHTIPASIWQAKLKTKGQTDVYVVDNKIAPVELPAGTRTPGPSLILVVAGTVTNYEGDDPSLHAARLQPGQRVHRRGRHGRSHPAERGQRPGRDDRCAVAPEGRCA